MSPEVAIILAGAFAAAFAAGATGFGDAVIASAIWLQFMAPPDAVPLIVACFFTMHIIMLALMHKRLDFTHLWPFLIGGAIGVPVGTELLRATEPDTFKRIIGGGLIVYAILMLMARNLPNIRRGGRPLDGAIGGIGGVLGGFAGLSGIMPGVWCTQRGWTRKATRGVTQPYILAMHGMALGWLVAGGQVPDGTLGRYLLALPAIALGAWFGVILYGRFDDTRFRQCVLGVLGLAGLILLFAPGET